MKTKTAFREYEHITYGYPTEENETCHVGSSSIGDINLVTWQANNALATGKIPTIAAFSPGRSQIPPEFIRTFDKKQSLPHTFLTLILRGYQNVNNVVWRLLKGYQKDSKNAFIFLPVLCYVVGMGSYI